MVGRRGHGLTSGCVDYDDSHDDSQNSGGHRRSSGLSGALGQGE